MTATAGPSGLFARIAAAPPSGTEGLGLWRELATRVDPAESRPTLAPDIELKMFRLRWGNDYAVIANPRALVHYRLEPAEAELLPLMDGTRTVKEILVERFRESGDLELSELADLVRQLHEGGFLVERFTDTRAMVSSALDPVSSARRRMRQFTKTLSIDWQGAHGLVAWLYRRGLKWFFLPAVAAILGLLAVAGFVAFLAVPRSGRFGLSGQDAAAASLALLVMNYLLTFVHELAHATALVHYGRRVKGAGFMIYFGSPAFFIESSDGLMLDRGQRVVQSFAGPYSELIIAGGASAFAWAFPDAGISPLLYRFALLNYFVIFLNLVPLLELDGYWILSDLIQVPDLRPRSLQFIRYDLWRKLARRDGFSKQEVGLALYGTLGVLFTIFALLTSAYFWDEVFGGLIRELWRGGPISKTLLIAVLVFIAGPVLRGLIALLRAVYHRVRGVVDAVRFRLETSWRVEAARLIDALPIFRDLPEDELSDLAGRVQLQTFPAGKPVFRQGDDPDAFYVIRTGVFQVVEEDPDTQGERVIRTLGRGESFGELALIARSPRAATVRAVEEGELFRVDRSTFDRLLADMANVPDFAPTLQAVAELRTLPAFAALGSDDLSDVLDRGTWVNVAPGETIIEQGEEGDAFYAIRSGSVEIVKDGRRERTLGPGAYFGEIALLSDVPRTASVVARTPARLFRLDREGFDLVVAGAFHRGTLNPAAHVGRTSQH
ncbi:MAG: cyclic nucleotide-binding domain-containing protein [Solirubrobacterales bacterium]